MPWTMSSSRDSLRAWLPLPAHPQVLADFRLHPESKPASLPRQATRREPRDYAEVPPVAARLRSPMLPPLAFTTMRGSLPSPLLF